MLNETKSLSEMENEVYACERAHLDAIAKGDVAALADMMSDNAIVLHASGTIESGRDFLANFGNRKYLSIEHRKLWLRSFGETTVVACSILDLVNQPKEGGDPVRRGLNQTTVWCRVGADWKLNTWHLTSLGTN